MSEAGLRHNIVLDLMINLRAIERKKLSTMFIQKMIGRGLDYGSMYMEGYSEAFYQDYCLVMIEIGMTADDLLIDYKSWSEKQ